MKSSEYRSNIRNIIKNSLNRKFPGLKQNEVTKLCSEIAIAIHARFYGAAVDNVASPIWRDNPNYAVAFSDSKAIKTAEEILNEGKDK